MIRTEPDWDDTMLRQAPIYRPKGQTMSKYPLETEAEVAARHLYDAAIRLAATPKVQAPEYHKGRAEAFEDAMEEMAAVVDRWRADPAPKRAEAA